MKKKLALIVISLDECFTEKGFSGGGHKVTKNLILELVASEKFEIDIFCQKGKVWENTVNGINSITILGKKNFKENLQTKLSEKKYDYVLSSDVLLPFANNLIHSNSSKFKSKNGKNLFLQKILKIYNHKKIKKQEENLAYEKATFCVSESLKQDYVTNYGLDENKVFVCYPSVDELQEFKHEAVKEFFTIGSMAGGGLNKGGYLLLLALSKLPEHSKIKARIIFPKIKKSFFFKLMISMLGLQKRVELLPKQANMQEFYQTVDCYVLPSLNEAFGLVVTEAASSFKPSLVSSTTGVRELISDGENGFVFDREKNPIKNLTEKLIEVSDIYLYEHDKYVEISKNAHQISAQLDWKKFGETIIGNMIEEVNHD